MRHDSNSFLTRSTGFGRLSAMAILLLLGACQWLPIDGPLASDVREELDLRQRVPFRMVQVAPDMIGILSEYQPQTETFIEDLGVAEPVIGPGDGLIITIAEPSAGGLFSGPPSITATGAEPGARVVTLPELKVDPDGRINVPFAGPINVNGLTQVQAAMRLQDALSGQAIGPQVSVTSVRESSSRVTVGGAVKAPGILQMATGGERLLEVVARAGGTTETAEKMTLQLTRFGAAHRVRMQTLLEHPETNIHVRAGDYLHLLIQPRDYLVLGATGKVEEQHLDLEPVHLATALARAGGLLDARADARSVMLFRNETPDVIERIAAVEARLARQRGEDAPIPPQYAPSVRGGAPVPTILVVNMRSASGLFMSRQLTLRDGDMIYVPNSSYTQLQKFLDLVRLTLGPAAAGVIAGKGL
jgi:polysaccharide export outer membrane protein